jgi:ABC-type polysaccharide/polyol phosphate export permease
VFFRDVQYLWSIIAQLLFYATPIIYTSDFIEEEWLRTITTWGPTGAFIRASHEIMYDTRMPGLDQWVYLAVVSSIVFAVGAAVFQHLSPRFAEEL